MAASMFMICSNLLKSSLAVKRSKIVLTNKALSAPQSEYPQGVIRGGNHPRLDEFSVFEPQTAPESAPAQLKTKKTAPNKMLTAEFLRRQAENCLRIARTCFDLASAERLRLMAAELNAKAVEIEQQTRQERPQPSSMSRSFS